MGSAGAKGDGGRAGRGRDLPPFRRPVRVGQAARGPSRWRRRTGLHCSRIDGAPLVYNQADTYMPDLLIWPPRMGPTSVLAEVARIMRSELTARAPSSKATITRWCSATNGAAIGEMVAHGEKTAPGFWRSHRAAVTGNN